MGPSILLQWSINPPPANLTDIVISRLLEHYSLTQPQRSAIYFRTYRATKDVQQPGPTTRLLTTIAYSTPSPILRETAVTAPRDDTSFLFLEDRSSHMPQTNIAIEKSDEPKENGKVGKEDKGLNEDGFEIITIPPDTPAPGSTDVPGCTTGKAAPPIPPSALTRMAQGKRGTYRMLAVKPSGNVLPLLQNLLSPFVMGVTKSARAAASTTAQTSTPTPLPGTPYLITSLSFPSLPAPHPSLLVTVHTLSSTPSSMIFLEAEWAGTGQSPSPAFAKTVLKEFLGGCIPEELGGERTYHEWITDDEEDGDGWTGVERTRRMTMLLARCLRETGYI